MIGTLRGTLSHKQPPALVVDVGGVGYELDAPMSTFYELPEVGGQVMLFTHLALREDALSLYGFATRAERSLFRDLIRVSGVGPRLALTVLSGISTRDFVRCVRESDTSALVRLPGVGKKTAERLVIEMRDRLGEAAELPGAAASGSQEAHASPVEDAHGALVALGYKPAEASRMIRHVDAEGLASEEIIRRALRATAPEGR